MRRNAGTRRSTPTLAMHIVRAILICLLCIAFKCHATSFDCEKKLTIVEEAICNDQEISELDEVLMRTYKLVMDISPNHDALKKEQKRWLSTVRNRCANSECLLKTYGERIAELETIWKTRTRQVRAAPDAAKPFEGRWERCQLFKGQEICSSYLLVQNGARVCGEWEYWATYRTYSGQLQAKTKGQEQAELTVICGTPGSETSTDCDNTAQPNGKWEKAIGGLSRCNGRLYDEPLTASCAALSKSPGFLYRPLSKKDRESLSSQAWLKRACLGDG